MKILNTIGFILSACLVAAFIAIGTEKINSMQPSASGRCDVSINGKCFAIPRDCHSTSIGASGVICDGKVVQAWGDEKGVVNVTLNGNVDIIKDIASVTVTGSAGSLYLGNGDATIWGDVKGAATVGNGDLTAHSVNGEAVAHNGNVICKP